jgi:Domain of unknown function (DUF4412)
MCKKLSVLLVGFFLLIVSSATVPAAGMAERRDYSADMVITTSHGTMNSKVYAKGLKQRMENKVEGKETIVISRFDKKIAWMCMQEQMMCMEMALNMQKEDIQSRLNDPNVKVEKEFIGNETVEGHATKKYHVTIFRDGQKENSGFLWEASDLQNFPVKYRSEDGETTILWKNISFGSIPESLFELPKGYEKMDMKMPGLGDMFRRKLR